MLEKTILVKCKRCGKKEKAKKHKTIFLNLLLSLNSNSDYYICKDCDKAQRIIDKKDEEEKMKKRQKKYRQKQKAWVKQRDKILKENE